LKVRHKRLYFNMMLTSKTYRRKHCRLL